MPGSTTKLPLKKSATDAPGKPSIRDASQPHPSFLDFFKDELRDIYWAENHLVKNLPRMQESASAASLVAAIGKHLKVTKTHVARLEQIFGLLGEPPKAKKCDAMEGLTKEAEGVIENTIAGTAVRDAGIIMASRKVEHYEASAYDSLSALARSLGLEKIAGILEQTLAEEKDADTILSAIAAKDINYSAASK